MHIEKAAYAFRITGEPISCVNFGHGHINSTFKIETDTGNKYILQRINHHVFTTESKTNNWYLQIVINFIFTDILKVTMKFPHEVPF